MKKRLLIFLFLLLSSVMLNAQAARLRIAVLDLEGGTGVQASLAKDISDLIRTELIDLNLSNITVLERTKMKEILKEHRFQMSGCVDTSCAVKIGQLLSANKILIGKASKFGKTYSINIRVVDVEKGTGEYAKSITTKSQDEIPQKIKELVFLLAKQIAGGRASKSSTDPYSVYELLRAPTQAVQYGITDKEWKEYQNTGLSMDQYISRNKKSHFSATMLALIPLYSGHYHIDKSCYFNWGNLFSLLDGVGVLIIGMSVGLADDDEEDRSSSITGMGIGYLIVSTAIDIITSNLRVANINNTIDKFEKFHLKAGINNNKYKFSFVYKF